MPALAPELGQVLRVAAVLAAVLAELALLGHLTTAAGMRALGGLRHASALLQGVFHAGQGVFHAARRGA